MTNKNLSPAIENKLLATHVSDNENFESACLSGDGTQIMAIIEKEMEKNKLYTKGSKKLRDDVFRMLQGKDKVSTYIGQNILFFIWNSRLAGIGLAVG